jgi:Lrp/AsnC family transcriptional regulator, leucine-responsive regulatory protein
VAERVESIAGIVAWIRGHLVPTTGAAGVQDAMMCPAPFTEEKFMPLDSVDRRMLAILQREGRIANAALAERLHLSPSPCLRRLRALERDGVIAGYRAVLDRARLGLGLTVFVEIKVEGHSEHIADAIGDALNAAPEVISAHVVSGPADFLLEVVVADLPAYERLLFGTLLRLPNVGDVRSHFALRTVKPPSPLPV